jgi:GDP-L-fucose synthase
MKLDSKIYVAGHKGLVGSALIRKLESDGYSNIIVVDRSKLDLTRQRDVEDFFEYHKPEYVFLSAAKVGGIGYNKSFPADFIRDNLNIQTNVIDSAYRYGTKKLLFLGSSCIYPKLCEQPIKEEYLMNGPLEPTNDSYAMAKISGIKLCKAYKDQYGFNSISLMPTNLYGPNDNFNLETSHVLPAMIAKFHGSLGKSDYWKVKLWGDGSAKREFLHVDDLAEACFVCMNKYDDSDIINVGTGKDITIKQLAEKIAKVVGYQNSIEWDTTKPNGTPRKVLNVDKIKSLGWEPKISLDEGLKTTVDWFLNNRSTYEKV